MQVIVITNNVRIKINVDLNTNNWLIRKGICDKGFAWNPSNCDCECNESCDVGEYLDYENCKRTKGLIDKLVKECSKNIMKTKWLI